MSIRDRAQAALLRTTGYRLQRPESESDSALPADYDPWAVEVIGRVQANTMTSPERLHGLVTATRYVVEAGVPGAFVECGVWRGGSMAAVALTLLAAGVTDRDLYLYDTFEGMPAPTERDRRRFDGAAAADLLAAAPLTDDNWAYAPIEAVRTVLADTGYPPERVHFIEGKIEDTVPDAAPDTIALLRLDTDWYESTRHELTHLYPRLSPLGVLIIDDYGWWEGARQAVDEWEQQTRPGILLNRLDVGRIAVKPVVTERSR